MTFSTKYLSFWSRLKKWIKVTLLAVIVLSVLSFFKGDFNESYASTIYFMLGLGIIFLFISFFKSKTLVTNVQFDKNDIIVSGFNFNKKWTKKFNIIASCIEIKPKKNGYGIEYYLKIISPENKVSINKSFNWEYMVLHSIYKEFKRIKGEKIIIDEKYALDAIEKKALGFSDFDIARGKEIKK